MIEILFPQFKKLFNKVKILEDNVDRLNKTLIEVRAALLNEDLPHSKDVALDIIDSCIGGLQFKPSPPKPPENRLIVEGSFPKRNNNVK